jgi:hypothetical protein
MNRNLFLRILAEKSKVESLASIEGLHAVSSHRRRAKRR